MKQLLIGVEDTSSDVIRHAVLKNDTGGSPDSTMLQQRTTDSTDCRQESSPSEETLRVEMDRRDAVHSPLAKVRFGPNIDTKRLDIISSARLSSLPSGPSLKNKNGKANSRQSVFERLSAYETVASIHRKLQSRQIRNRSTKKRSSSAPPSIQRTFSAPLPSSNNLKSTSVKLDSNSRRNYNKKVGKEVPSGKPYKLVSQLSFDRLAESHTKLSKIRQRARPLDKNLRKNSFRSNGGMHRVRSTSRGRIPLQNANFRKGNIIHSTNFDLDFDKDNHDKYMEQKEFDDEFSSVAAMSVPYEIEFTSRMQIYTTNTHKPEDGYHELDPSELQLNSSLAEYEAGGLSVKDLATEIVSMMLLRDLDDEADWAVENPLYRDLALPLGEVGYSFFVEATEKVGENGGEIIASASATGNIVFIHDLSEIHIENWSFVSDEI